MSPNMITPPFIHHIFASQLAFYLFTKLSGTTVIQTHDDVMKLKHFPRYWPFVRGIHRSPVNSPHKGQWRGALVFSFHYNDVIMRAMASQITSLTIVYSTVYSRRRSKKTSKLRVTGLCDGNSPVTCEFPAQMASNAENVSIWWRRHGTASE